MSEHGDVTEVESPTPTAATAEPVSLSRNTSFRMLWIGQVLSDTGSQIGYLAYPLLILALTHSAVLAGGVGSASAVVKLVLRLPAGALSDRLDRRRTMIICDGVRTVLLAGLAAAVILHAVSWPMVAIVAVVDGLGDLMFTPSSMAALPGIVAPAQLEEAWAATEARQFGAGLAGPALGGLLYSVGRAVPFAGDAASYGVSAFTSSRLRGEFAPAAVDPAERRGLWHEAFQGVKLMWKNAVLRAVVIQAPLINFAFSGAIFTITIALRRHGTSAGVIGVVQAAISVGGLLGAIAAPKLQGRLKLSQMVLVLTGGGALLFALASWLMPSVWLAVPITISLFVSPTSNAALFAVLLRESPEAMRGRVNSALLMAATALASLAPITAGLLVQHVSSNWAMGAFAMTLAISTVLTLSLKGLREAETGLT